MRLTDGRLDDLVTRTDVMDAPIEGRLSLAGRGGSFDEAIGRSSGHVGIVGKDGTVRKDVALYGSGDALKTIVAAIGKPTSRVPLRCLIADFTVKDGVMTPRTLAFTTDKSRVDGSGTIWLNEERVGLSFTGRSDHPGLLQSTAPLRLGGTLSATRVETAAPGKPASSKPKLLGQIGEFLHGLKTRGDTGRAVPAAPLDCRATSAAALAE